MSIVNSNVAWTAARLRVNTKITALKGKNRDSALHYNKLIVRRSSPLVLPFMTIRFHIVFLEEQDDHALQHTPRMGDGIPTHVADSLTACSSP